MSANTIAMLVRTMPSSAYPPRQPNREASVAVMSSGPSVAPTPYDACSHVTTPAENRAAAKALIPASMAPAPRPARIAQPTITGHVDASA